MEKCRHNFPKFPLPETTILRRYNEVELKDRDFMKIQMNNLNIITKYILRTTKEEWDRFEKLTFDGMLEDIGLSKDEYVMALRGTVKVSF